MKQSRANRVLIKSPDTDVYHIGLPLECTHQKQVLVQISPINSRELRLLNLTNLVDAMRRDPDLAAINPTILPQVLQTLYVVSGCDYISFFRGIGKATFLRYFCQHAPFITGCLPNTVGTLAETSLNDDSHAQGFLAFLRLVGTTYFKKHATGFDTPSPVEHFSKFLDPLATPLQQHTAWLEDIRQNIWARVSFESDMIPSDDALWRHWKRSCWVVDLWKQADKNCMIIKPVTEHGWQIRDSNLTFDWDSSTNIDAVRQRVSVLTKGCRCVTGCSTARCGCKKKSQLCSEGCDCSNCVNLATATTPPSDSAIAEVAVEEAFTTDRSHLHIDNIDELMDWVFDEDINNSTVDTDSSDEEDVI